jgi:hypothetical protein
MSFLNCKIFTNAFRNISLGFCCLGAVNEQENFSAQGCQVPRISAEVVQVLSPPDDLFYPLQIERRLCQSTQTPFCSPLVAAAAQGDLALVRTLIKQAAKNGCSLDCDALDQACLAAASHGQLEVLKYLVNKGLPECSHFIPCEVLDNCCISAASHGHLKVLKYLFKEVFSKSACFIEESLLNTCSVCAAAHGHLETLKFLFAKGFPENVIFIEDDTLQSCTIFAATNGHINVLEFLFRKVFPRFAFSLNEELFRKSLICASTHQQLDTVRFLIKLASSEKYWYLDEAVLSDCRLFVNLDDY